MGKRAHGAFYSVRLTANRGWRVFRRGADCFPKRLSLEAEATLRWAQNRTGTCPTSTLHGNKTPLKLGKH